MSGYEREGFANWASSIGVMTHVEATKVFDAIAAHPWVSHTVASRREPRMTLSRAASVSVAAVGAIEVDGIFADVVRAFAEFWARVSIKVLAAVGVVIAAAILIESSIVLMLVVAVVLLFLFSKEAVSAGKSLVDTVMERLRSGIETI
jgi:hypothetical protein